MTMPQSIFVNNALIDSLVNYRKFYPQGEKIAVNRNDNNEHNNVND